MANQRKTHYNLRELITLLEDCSTPRDLGNQIDEIMNDLVHYAGTTDGYSGDLRNRYFLLRELRNIFWKLESKK